jgi:multidrug resistance efflux pump
MPHQNEINLRSEQVQEILTKMPSWMIRWGSVVVFLVILSVVVFSYFIKYPEIISSQIIITTQNPPEKLVAKTSGKIEVILTRDNALVNEKFPLAIIENSANYKDVFLLKRKMDSIKIDTKLIDFDFRDLSLLQLGPIQPAYSAFEKDFETYKLNNVLEPYVNEKAAQGLEIKQLMERLQFVKQQKANSETELQLKQKELDRYKILLQKKVIAAQEFESKNIEYLQVANNFKGLASQQSQLTSSINELRKNTKNTIINEVKDKSTFYRNVLQSYSLLKKAINEWELTYVVSSSIEGRVSFMQVWVKNQTINTGETVFIIVPNGVSNFIGKLKAKTYNAGKLKIGQMVNIRLQNYPDREFGVLKGKVKSISPVPDKEGDFLIDVILPCGLETSYRKKIIFQQEMVGTADIITEDLTLLERLLYQFRDVLKRK